MDDLNRFEQQVREKLASVTQCRSEQKEALRREMEERVRRVTTYEDNERRLMDSVIYPRVEAVVQLFPNAALSPGKGEVNSHLRCQFQKTPDFPANTTLTFSVSPDLEVKNAIVTYDLEILPIYFEFQGHDQLVLSIERIDERTLGHWIESKLLGFMDAYLRLQTLDQYQTDNQVVDPVCQIRFHRAAAEAEAVFAGCTYYFCLDECRRKFLADPHRYLTVPGPRSQTCCIGQSQQLELKRESAELEDLGREIREVRSRVATRL